MPYAGYHNLYLFIVAALLLLIVPGPNMTIVSSHAVAHGWRAGLAAALGITLADVLMTIMVSAGLGALMMSWAPAFDLLRWAGAGYLMWLTWQALEDSFYGYSVSSYTGLDEKDLSPNHAQQLVKPQGAVVFHGVSAAVCHRRYRYCHLAIDVLGVIACTYRIDLSCPTRILCRTAAYAPSRRNDLQTPGSL